MCCCSATVTTNENGVGGVGSSTHVGGADRQPMHIFAQVVHEAGDEFGIWCRVIDIQAQEGVLLQR